MCDMTLRQAQGTWKSVGDRLLTIACRAGFVPREEWLQAWDIFLACLQQMETEGSLCVPFPAWNAAKKTWAKNLTITVEEFAHTFVSSPLAVSMEESRGNVNPDSQNRVLRQVPFVVDEQGERFYLQRQFAQEMRIAWHLRRMARTGVPSAAAAAENLLRRAARDGYLSAEQRNAVELALMHQVALICGGPGTGKTRTVAFLLEAMLLSGAKSIFLAAPTGKAASRVLESVEATKAKLPALFLRLQQEKLVQHTLHKWLTLPTQSGKRPGVGNCLSCDVFIIDEASMMDADLAERVLSVIDPQRTKVVFLGDKNQLAAVGPGSVLADMTCSWFSGGTVLPVAQLTHSRRYGESSPFGLLASFILNGAENERNASHVQALCTGKCQIKWVDPARPAKALIVWLRKVVGEYALAVRKAAAAQVIDREHLRSLWRQASSFRLLAAERTGCMGVDSVNAMAEAIMRQTLKINNGSVWYPGKLIIVRANDDQLGVSNGELAMVVRDAKGCWFAYFGDKDKENTGQDGMVATTNFSCPCFLPVSLLPDAQSAFAITIHQSQGSEFRQVAVVMPSSSGSPLASRELLYTAVTRVLDAPHQGIYGSLQIFGSKNVVETALRRRAQRSGGLQDRLRSVDPEL